MKYTCEINIDKDLNTVIDLFKNPDNLVKWQKGFISIEHLSGEIGQVGSKSKLKYKMGKREIVMRETITVMDLPNEFSAIYEADKVWNEVKNYFVGIGDNQTKWTSHCEFRFNGYMRLMGFLMPGAFKKQSMKYLEEFKKFVENSK